MKFPAGFEGTPEDLINRYIKNEDGLDLPDLANTLEGHLEDIEGYIKDLPALKDVYCVAMALCKRIEKEL